MHWGGRQTSIIVEPLEKPHSLETPHSPALAGMLLTLEPISPAGLQAVRCGARLATSPSHPPVLLLLRRQFRTVQRHPHQYPASLVHTIYPARATVLPSLSLPWSQCSSAMRCSACYRQSLLGSMLALSHLHNHEMLNLQP